jgi:hypothetical protein
MTYCRASFDDTRTEIETIPGAKCGKWKKRAMKSLVISRIVHMRMTWVELSTQVLLQLIKFLIMRKCLYSTNHKSLCGSRNTLWMKLWPSQGEGAAALLTLIL